MDDLAKNGTDFENAYANGPFTAASFISILGSSYPLDNGKCFDIKKFKLLSEVLNNNKIKTYAVHSNPYLSSYFGYNKGWDKFEDFMKEENKTKRNFIPKFVKESSIYQDVKNSILSFELPYANAYQINDKVKETLKDNKDPFFLWVHYMDLHEPYIKDGKKITIKESNKTELKSNYDLSLTIVDCAIERLYNIINKHSKDTVFIITSDHGQEFYEEGIFGHKARYNEKTLHIPLIVFPYKKEVKTNLVNQTDIPFTIAELFNLKPYNKWKGINLFHSNKYKSIAEAKHNEDGSWYPFDESKNNIISRAEITKEFQKIKIIKK